MAIDPALVESYLVRTRWFGGKGRPFRVSDVRALAELPGGPRGMDATVYLVAVDYADAEGGRELYQVPLAAYDEIEERIGLAYVGPLETDGHVRHLYDAVHVSDAMALWLEGFIAAESGGVADVGAATTGGDPASVGDGAATTAGEAAVDGLRFHRLPASAALDPELRSSPLTGEQSNSSARFGDTAIMKLFRKVGPGINPDIEIHEALTRGGSEHIAELYGWVETDVDGEVLQLAMLQEFLRTATDGFELAMGSIRTLLADPDQSVADSGGDFAGEAARLGEALAEVHATLRERFPAQRLGSDAAARLANALSARLNAARSAVPELEPFAAPLHELYGAVGALDGLDVQRVHGDLHLGQTLRTSHGWRIVDFEGEPGRAFAERALADSPWRDVAGMLRSFDYAPGVIEMSLTGAGGGEQAALRAARAAEWSARARSHFVDAYIAATAPPDQTAPAGADRRTLLNAFVADKAVYEVVYEKRSRPTWVSIPLAALARISGA